MVASLRDAYYEHYMTHGVATRKFEDLIFTLPSSFEKIVNNSFYNCVQNEDMFCCMTPSYK